MSVIDSAARSAGSATAGLREHGDLNPRIWPLSACALADGEISVGGVSLAEIAARYGTPAYVLDEADVRQRCRGYRQAFGAAEIAYAGKAFLCRAHGAMG
jgi:diaminopimelate decarboxylase